MGTAMLKTRVIFLLAMGMTLALTACAPAAAPTATPTKAPAAAATSAPVAAPTTALQATPTKPAAPAPTAPPAATAPPKAVTLQFGSIQSVSDAGVYVAIDKGYFKEQGITINVNNFRTVAELIAPLGTGQLDFMATPLSTALLAAADRGVELKIVADKGQSLPKWEFAWISLRKDLADSGQVKTAADLKGMKIAVPSPGSLGDQTAQMMIEQAGLKPTDAEIVVMAFTDQAAALANKGIAAGYAVEPYIATGIQQGFAVKWIPNSQFFGGRVETATIIYGSSILKDPDLAKRWMVAYLKGIRDYTKAFTTKEGRQEVVDILIKYSTIKDPKLYDVMEMPFLDPNGVPDKKSMDAQYKFFVDKALYTGKKTFDDITDLSYAAAAAQQLGKQ
ncbi:MAG: ABC transporter substrate-binding protein [Dehalococcoidia bacterium]|nr:ABC transporter substrate-binding protein [Dehalococcoidia bacterium]